MAELYSVPSMSDSSTEMEKENLKIWLTYMCKWYIYFLKLCIYVMKWQLKIIFKRLLTENRNNLLTYCGLKTLISIERWYFFKWIICDKRISLLHVHLASHLVLTIFIKIVSNQGLKKVECTMIICWSQYNSEKNSLKHFSYGTSYISQVHIQIGTRLFNKKLFKNLFFFKLYTFLRKEFWFYELTSKSTVYLVK